MQANTRQQSQDGDWLELLFIDGARVQRVRFLPKAARSPLRLSSFSFSFFFFFKHLLHM